MFCSVTEVPTASFEATAALANDARGTDGRILTVEEVSNIIASAHITGSRRLATILRIANETQVIEGCPALTRDDITLVLKAASENGLLGQSN